MTTHTPTPWKTQKLFDGRVRFTFADGEMADLRPDIVERVNGWDALKEENAELWRMLQERNGLVNQNFALLEATEQRLAESQAFLSDAVRHLQVLAADDREYSEEGRRAIQDVAADLQVGLRGDGGAYDSLRAERDALKAALQEAIDFIDAGESPAVGGVVQDSLVSRAYVSLAMILEGHRALLARLDGKETTR